MNDHRPLPPANDIDPGEPVAQLAGWEEESSELFLNLVRRKIYRRSATSHFACFTWDVPGMLLREFLEFLVHLLNPSRASKGGPS
jgi:hypothetical protein